MPKITKRLVDAAAPQARDVMLWDNEVPGFGLRIKPSGARSFLVQYRNASGRSRRLTIGRYGVFTPEAARSEARARLAEVARGLDPAEKRRADREALTVRQLCQNYVAAAEGGHIITRRGRAKKASTLGLDRGRIDRHIVPLIGHRPVADITTADIRGVLRDISNGKTRDDVKTKARGRAIVKGGRGAGSRVLGLLGGIFTYAVDEGIRTDNPVRGVKRPADQPREFRLDAAGYARLGQRLRAADRIGERWQVTDSIRLLALTGCRRGEIMRLRRDEVDIAGKVLRLGDTKTGKSVRPLGRAAIDALQAVMTRSNGEYIFPASRGSGPYMGLPKAWRLIVTRRLPRLTPHGLRHSFASVGEDCGLSVPTIGALLGHSGHGVTAGYIHKADAALTAAANQVAAWINEVMSGAGEPSNVVKLTARVSHG